MAQAFNRKKILFLAEFSILLGIEAVVCFTPLGALPALGPIVATLSHVPVIVTAVLLGPAAGALMGFSFGLFSFLVWTFTLAASPVAFVFTPVGSTGAFHGNFWSIVICFVPRILIGLVAGGVFRLLQKGGKRDFAAAAFAGVLGALTNTVLVLGGIWLFFGRNYAQAAGFPYETILMVIGGTILTSGLPEALIGGVAGSGVALPVKRALKK